MKNIVKPGLSVYSELYMDGARYGIKSGEQYLIIKEKDLLLVLYHLGLYQSIREGMYDDWVPYEYMKGRIK